MIALIFALFVVVAFGVMAALGAYMGYLIKNKPRWDVMHASSKKARRR